MRRFSAFILAVTIVLSLLPSLFVTAEDKIHESNIKIYVNGTPVATDKPPVIVNSRTLAPIRAVAEKCDISVSWDGAEKKVTLSRDFTTVTVAVGSTSMQVYNSIIDKLTTQELDAAPVIIDSSTYITLRAVLEALGERVEWDGKTESIYVISQGVDSDSKPDTEADGGVIAPEVKEEASDKPKEEIKEEPKEDTKEETKEESKDKPDEQPEAEITYDIAFSGFREMENHTIEESAPHGLYGRIKTNAPITMVRCRIVGTEMDYSLHFKMDDDIRSYNVFTYFDKLMCFSDAGLGEQVFEVYTAVNENDAVLLFSYEYTVTEKPSEDGKEYSDTNDEAESDSTDTSGEKPTDKPDDDKKEVTENTDKAETKPSKREEKPQSAAISYYGFRKMTNDKISAGAPHGLYGSIVSDHPITMVRCRIAGTDMDFAVELKSEDNITSYNVFTYFDKLIRFSDAGYGKQKFEIFAGTEGEMPKLLFSYSYKVIRASQQSTQKPTEDKTDNSTDTPSKPNPDSDNDSDSEKVTDKDIDSDNKDEDEDDENENEVPYIPEESDVVLPLEGTIRVTSPYGFRAYNKWEFHKGVDIISTSLNIIAVADGRVVDCATGRNSGAGNYVALEHDGGWVSLYYHLASYDVEIGDKVKKGEKFATMGNTGGSYGVHLHFMACDKWYGSLWATQNNHHKPPHEYVPQLLDSALYYNPNFESVNKDKLILFNFHFPKELEKGSAFSISASIPQIASENPLESITLTVTDDNGDIHISETINNPKWYTQDGYTYTTIGADFDAMCEFDTLPAGKMHMSVSAVTTKGRERVVYTRDFTVIPVKKTVVASEVHDDSVNSDEISADTDTEEITVQSAENSGSEE